MTDVSIKSTKQEIISAYEDLLKKYDKVKNSTLSQSSNTEIKQIKLNISDIDIFSQIDEIRINFAKELNIISNKLNEKIQEINNIEENIENEKKYLDQVLKIKTQAESLFALIDLQNQEKQKFEEEMVNKKRDLKKQEDDWKFNFEQLKQKETYEWEIKKEDIKRKFDQEINKKIFDLKQKEEVLDIKLEENKKLSLEVDRLRNELDNISQKLEIQITEKVKGEFDREKIMLLKDFELKEKIAQLENKNLQSKIEELQKQNINIQKSLDNSTLKIEQLASKVVEGSRPLIFDKNSQENKL